MQDIHRQIHTFLFFYMVSRVAHQLRVPREVPTPMAHKVCPLQSHIRTIQAFNSCISRPDVWQCLVVKTPIDNMSKNRPCTSMAYVACESKLRSVGNSSMHPCPENWVEIGRADVYCATAVQAVCAGTKCRHCIYVCRNTNLERVSRRYWLHVNLMRHPNHSQETANWMSESYPQFKIHLGMSHDY